MAGAQPRECQGRSGEEEGGRAQPRRDWRVAGVGGCLWERTCRVAGGVERVAGGSEGGGGGENLSQKPSLWVSSCTKGAMRCRGWWQ